MIDLKQDIIQSVPLSSGQRQIWFLKQLDQQTTALYHIGAYHIRGMLQTDPLTQALTELVRRQPALRTTFDITQDDPSAVVHSTTALYFQELHTTAEHLPALLEQQAQQTFSISEGQHWQLTLITLAPDDHVLLYTLDQLIADRHSAAVFVPQLLAIYRSMSMNGHVSGLVAAEVLQESAAPDDLRYWKETLETAPPLLSLPLDAPRPASRSLRGGTLAFEIPQKATAQLASYGANRQDVLLALFAVLLARYTQESDFVIGMESTVQRDLLGQDTHLLPLHLLLEGNPTFCDWLQVVRRTREEAATHADVPFDQIVNAVNPGRDLSYSPLFQVLFHMEDAPEFPEWEMLPLPLAGQTALYDLTLSIQPAGNHLLAMLEYNCDLFHASTIEHMRDHYLTLLEDALLHPEKPVFDLQLLTAEEEERILHEWVTTPGEILRDQTIHGMFEEHAAKIPHATAILMDDREISYAALNGYANQLAHYLLEQGVQDGSVVGICIERSLDVIITNLAVLKCGATYVPLDPAYPPERLSGMIEDTGASVIISRMEYRDLLADFSGMLIPINSQWDENSFANYPAENPALHTENSIACILFTSGSTGKPKGVKSGHTSIINRLGWWTRAYPLQAEETWCAKSALNVVDSVWEVFGALLAGVRLVIIPEDTLANLHQFVEVLGSHRITRIVMVPSLLRAVLEEPDLPQRLPDLRIWITTGELLSASLLHRFRDVLPGKTLLNFYGCSESPTIAVSDLTHPHPLAETHIGRPRDNIQVYVLDRYLHPVPVGVSGEIFVGGIGLSDGYVNRPELMERTFIPNPFEPGTRLYRTGDIARFLPDGNIQLVGRSDHQVKIRGFRVEPGEIESRLRQHPAVNNVLVTPREKASGETYLVAYFVCHNGMSVTISELRNFLGQALPLYMVPSTFMQLDAFPLMKNGKIDRQSLPEPTFDSAHNRDFILPRTELEQEIAALWTKILGVETIGIHDNFFELGGHSLAAGTLLAQIEMKLGKRLPIGTLFQGPTVEKLALAVSGEGQTANGAAGSQSLIPVQVGDPARLPFFWMHSSDFTYLQPYFDPDQPFYCIMPSGMNEGEEIFDTEDGIVEHHIRVMQSLQPEGPYLMGGYCNGGKTALAMAKRLLERGHEVRLLALVDVPVPDVLRKERRKQPLPQRMLKLLREGRFLKIFKMRLWDRIEGLIHKEDLDEETIRLDEIVEAHDDVFDFYIVSEPYPQEVTLFTCAELYERADQNFTERWQKLTTQPLKQYVIPGDHITMITQPNIRILGESLMKAITQAQQQP